MAGRVDQDVELVATLPTRSQARVDDDLTLVAALPTTAKVRWDGDVILLALGQDSSRGLDQRLTAVSSAAA
jgi:hypothetical protein